MLALSDCDYMPLFPSTVYLYQCKVGKKYGQLYRWPHILRKLFDFTLRGLVMVIQDIYKIAAE